MARNIAARREAARMPTAAMVYADAGHGLSRSGHAPMTTSNANPMRVGGSTAATARAQADASARTLQFLATHPQSPQLGRWRTQILALWAIGTGSASSVAWRSTGRAP
jgi:hypothetical protein